MDFKERGITIGDLLIIFIIILTTTILVKSFNKDKKTTLHHSLQEEVSYNMDYLSKIHSNFIYF